MKKFSEIAVGQSFVAAGGDEFRKLNSHEALPINGPSAGFDDCVAEFSKNAEVEPLNH